MLLILYCPGRRKNIPKLHRESVAATKLIRVMSKENKNKETRKPFHESIIDAIRAISTQDDAIHRHMGYRILGRMIMTTTVPKGHDAITEVWLSRNDWNLCTEDTDEVVGSLLEQKREAEESEKAKVQAKEESTPSES